MSEFSAQFLRETQAQWTANYKEPITEADSQDISRNVTDFLSLLIEWEEQSSGEATYGSRES